MTKPTIRELLDALDRTDDSRAEELAERVEAVLKLHEPMDYGDDKGCCFVCRTMLPCSTLQALDGEM